MTAAATSPILPTATPFLPGAIAKSMMVIRKVRRWVRSRLAPVHLESKTWPEMSGNGVLIITSFIGRDRKRTRAGRPPALSECIVAAVGNRASAVYGQRCAVRTCPGFRATISASGSFASAIEVDRPLRADDAMDLAAFGRVELTTCSENAFHLSKKKSRRRRRPLQDVNVVDLTQ